MVGGEAAEELGDLAEAWWADPHAVDWQAPGRPVVDVLDSKLWELFRANIRPGDVLPTVADGRPNMVVRVDRAGVWVETERSRRSGSGPQPIEPRMIEVGYAALVADGELTNRRLLRELRVHRSSFVCALLARLPQRSYCRPAANSPRPRGAPH